MNYLAESGILDYIVLANSLIGLAWVLCNSKLDVKSKYKKICTYVGIALCCISAILTTLVVRYVPSDLGYTLCFDTFILLIGVTLDLAHQHTESLKDDLAE